MKNKRVQLCESESVLEDFYNALASNNSYAMKKVHIPKSDVFYVREAIYNKTGEWYTLDHVESCLLSTSDAADDSYRVNIGGGR